MSAGPPSISDPEKGSLEASIPSFGPNPCVNLSQSQYYSISELFQRLRKCFLWKFKESRHQTRDPKIRILEDKHRGYRSLGTFVDSDQSFMLYRRFGYLHARTLLRKQDELRILEAELDEYDDEDASNNGQGLKLLMCRDADETADKGQADGKTRTMILEEIELKLKSYDDWILQSQQMVALNRPATRDYNSVERFIFDKKPLIDEESTFIYRNDDLITLRDGREMAPLDSFTEKLLQIFHCSLLQRMFCTKEDRARTDDPNLHYYSRSRKNILITSILTLVLLCLLILPVFLLYRLAMDENHEATYTISIGILLVFTLVFSAVLSLFTQAKRHEIFGAAAAYCAVLVVFISNIPGSK